MPPAAAASPLYELFLRVFFAATAPPPLLSFHCFVSFSRRFMPRRIHDGCFSRHAEAEHFAVTLMFCRMPPRHQ